jgi:serine/threonine protein kinase
LTPQRTAHIGAEVLAALRAAHDAGVLHRDVKPANVLMSNDGRVVLTDFGIAMVEGSSALTMTGEVIGSPEFLAPERALGRTPGPESDLWSLGVLLYAAVEGNSPFRQNTPLSTLRAIVDEELPPPQLAGPLTPVIEGLLRKDPAERLSAEQAERDLRLVAAGGTPRAATGRRRRTRRRWRGIRRTATPPQDSRTPPTPVQGFGPPPGSYRDADGRGRTAHPAGGRRDDRGCGRAGPGDRWADVRAAEPEHGRGRRTRARAPAPPRASPRTGLRPVRAARPRPRATTPSPSASKSPRRRSR